MPFAFKRVSKRISKEYRKKGYSKKRADYIGNATAAKIDRAKHSKRGK